MICDLGLAPSHKSSNIPQNSVPVSLGKLKEMKKKNQPNDILTFKDKIAKN